MVYICPKSDDHWFKFKDQIVTKCTTHDAVEDNYASAYMLVYVKIWCVEEIVREVTRDEVVCENLICKYVKTNQSHSLISRRFIQKKNEFFLHKMSIQSAIMPILRNAS